MPDFSAKMHQIQYPPSPPIPWLQYRLDALSGNDQSLCFSLRLCFSTVTTSSARQTTGGPRTRGTDSWLDDTDKKIGPNLPLLFKLHENWSLDYPEN